MESTSEEEDEDEEVEVEQRAAPQSLQGSLATGSRCILVGDVGALSALRPSCRKCQIVSMCKWPAGGAERVPSDVGRGAQGQTQGRVQTDGGEICVVKTESMFICFGFSFSFLQLARKRPKTPDFIVS